MDACNSEGLPWQYKSEGLTENAEHEIAGHENTGHEFARHDKYRMKIDYITLESAFLINFKSFVCKASVLTYKKLNCACSSHTRTVVRE